MNLLRIYDVDGTITTPGNDLWYLITRSLCSSPSMFDNYVELWKKSLKSGACPYESSKFMMQQGIECIDKIYDQNHIKNCARELSDRIIRNKHYYPSAINHICASIEAGFQIVFSTTNYCEGAEAFLEMLLEHNLIRDHHQNRIISSGSIIDWKMRSIVHFNMGKDKILGVSEVLNIPVDQLSSYTHSVYGDDPEGNDAGILSLSKKSFVIANRKNAEVHLPETMIRTSWEDILENYL